MVNDPTGRWIESHDENEEREAGSGGGEFYDSVRDAEDVRCEQDVQPSAREKELADRERELELLRREREVEFGRRERELMQRELEIARREIAILRQNECAVMTERGSRVRETREEQRGEAAMMSRPLSGMNIKTIAELVSEFDGTPDNFDVWQKQVSFMKTTYELADDAAKTLIGMKLKKKAFEWLHSRAEHLSMTFDELMDELRRMYRPKKNKIDLRKRFETRVWKRGETFREYAHDKLIMGNRVPIDKDDMLDYLIEGISDRALCNQARIQCFTTKESLIDAFDKITLREQPTASSTQQEKRSVMSTKSMRGGKRAEAEKDESVNDGKKTNRKSCFNCGLSGHVSAECPSKGLGPKCFNCGEYGHIAPKCPKKTRQ
ncbi:uncharacterized protein [Anoplolepis gracilipes]|uniref:uncharacterized protein n=1 Tax=Anoplolepis gracilipes TaxID=354296 RepID=UPI003B9E4861